MTPFLYNIKDMNGNSSNYYIDDFCNIFELVENRFLPIHVHYRKKDGRPVVILNLNGRKQMFLAYRLLVYASSGLSYESFKDLVIDHIDCNPSNNRIDNLEIVPQKENMRRAGINNLMPYGESHFNSKYSDSLINGICEDIVSGLNRQEIINKYSINGQLIDDIKSGRSHKKISSKYIDKGFRYKTYDNSIGETKAIEVCKLLEKGYSISEVSKMTGYGRNFVEPIKNKRTYKYISNNYSF